MQRNKESNMHSVALKVQNYFKLNNLSITILLIEHVVSAWHTSNMLDSHADLERRHCYSNIHFANEELERSRF